MHSKTFQTAQIAVIPKTALIIVLSYLEKISQIIETRITRTMSKYIIVCKLWVIS